MVIEILYGIIKYPRKLAGMGLIGNTRRILFKTTRSRSITAIVETKHFKGATKLERVPGQNLKQPIFISYKTNDGDTPVFCKDGIKQAFGYIPRRIYYKLEKNS